MTKCWQYDPADRPTFKDLYTNTSSYITRIAGYLEITDFNPFHNEYVVARQSGLASDMDRGASDIGDTDTLYY